jgi:hypothetical protein
MKILWSRLKHFFDNLDGKMDADRYFEVCDQLNKEPIEEEIPPDFNDFPEIVQNAINGYGSLGDRVAADIGFLGKQYDKLPFLLEINGIETDYDKELFISIIEWLERRAIKSSADSMKRQRDKIKNKGKAIPGKTPKHRG